MNIIYDTNLHIQWILEKILRWVWYKGERDVLVSHGSSRFITEKFFDHSDKFTEFICRCGKTAIVNISKGIYKCNYCKDLADIYSSPTSWSSKLFMQELESMNVGIKRRPESFTYEKEDESIFRKIYDGRNQDQKTKI